MSAAVDVKTAAELIGVSERHIRRMCEAGSLPGAVRDGSAWRIPRSAHQRLVIGGQRPAADFDRQPKHKQDIAFVRLGHIRRAEAFCAAAVRDGGTRRQALAAYCRQAEIKQRTCQRWMRDYKDHGLIGLIDRRGAAGPGKELISEAAWQEFLTAYLDPRQPSVRQCYDVVCLLNTQRDHGWTLPSLRRMQQLAAEKIPLPVRVLHREGQAAYDAKCAPYIQTDMDSIEPGSVWVGDHHPFDCWIRHRGKWLRPWITAWLDMRSRAIVGWQITAAPNSTTILQAFRHGCRRVGPPDAVKIDNGKDYDCELFTGTTKKRRRLAVAVDETNIAGLYALMDIGVSFAIPYHPQAKSIERWFDTLESQYIRSMATYCGKDSARRPEQLTDYLKTDRAVAAALELGEFADAVGGYIDIYNRTPHTGRGMDGRTPLEVLHTRRSRRMVAEETLELLCQVWTPPVKVGKNGVCVKGLYYGQYDPTLLMHQGRSVRCTYDPDDVSQVRVFDAHTYRYLATAEQAAMVAYGAADDTDLREAMAAKARARRQVRQYKPAARIAAMDLPQLTLDAARQRSRPAAAEPAKPVRPVPTPLDGQAAAIKRTERTRAVKRAAGAEGLREVITLDWDFDRDEPDRTPMRLDWDDDDQPPQRTPMRLDWDDNNE